MNDTNTDRQFLNHFNVGSSLSSSEVHELQGDSLSLVTVKRRLAKLTESGLLVQSGAGRSVKYALSRKGQLLKPLSAQIYLAQAPDSRRARTGFDFGQFELPYVSVLSDTELDQLEFATATYRAQAKGIDPNLRSKELTRFIVEFSWKTSQIEGNTYDLISTERLLLYGEKSPNNTEFEAQMIINQKKALEFILDSLDQWAKPTLAMIDELHRFVGDRLDIPQGVRKSAVGITGTSYRPLDNEFQTKEAIEQLLKYLADAPSVYERALMAVLGLSYIQPFVDGNKRTARLLANAILLAGNLAPLSYRSVDDQTYKEATLLFYEQGSVVAFKDLFVNQYLFAAQNYNIAEYCKSAHSGLIHL